MSTAGGGITPPLSAVHAATPATPYVEWPAIFAGAAVATAVALLLTAFGSGVGLSMVSLQPGEGVSLRWVTIAAGIWFIWVAVTSFAAGGYLAGRLRRPIGDAVGDEVEARDGAHGIVVWATAALFGAALAASGVSGLATGAASAASGAAGGLTELMSGPVDRAAGRALRSQSGGLIASPEVRDELVAVLTASMADGEVAPDDRAYLAEIVADASGTPPADAQAQVDAALADLETARLAAVETIEQARVAGVIATFVFAATLLISAMAAGFAAVAGGRHRDQGVMLRGAAR